MTLGRAGVAGCFALAAGVVALGVDGLPGAGLGVGFAIGLATGLATGFDAAFGAGLAAGRLALVLGLRAI